jgi:hypothetical protein
MPFPISLTEEQYSALVTLAREGVKNPDGGVLPEKSRRLEAFLRDIEETAGIKRHILWVQWQETDYPLPAGTSFPETWPPELRFYLEFVTRPIAKVDVEKALDANARKPMNVLVTRDPAAIVGWTELNTYFANG